MAFLCSVNYSLTVISQEVVGFFCVYVFVVVVSLFVCIFFQGLIYFLFFSSFSVHGE